MDHSTEFFIGIDVAKTHNAFAIADGERDGEIRYLGEVDASEESTRRLVKRIAANRLITELGLPCMVVAPSLIPRKPGDRIKTNRRDAVALAKLLPVNSLPHSGMGS